MFFRVACGAVGDLMLSSSEAIHRSALLAPSGGDSVTVMLDVSPIIMAVLLGAFCGAVVGLILGRIVRFTAYLIGRHVEGNFLILIGGLAGAAVFVWLTVARAHP